MKHILVVFSVRLEAIKMEPMVKEFKRHSSHDAYNNMTHATIPFDNGYAAERITNFINILD